MSAAMARGTVGAALSPWRGAWLVLLIAAACSGPVDPRSAPAPGETRTFEGTWSASGSRLGALTTAFCLLVFLVLGTPWLLMIVR